MSLMTSASTISEFLTGGNAVFTLSNPVTGVRFTYKLRVKKDDSTVWFLSLLTGPDNTEFGDYSYLGMFDPVALSFRTTRKSCAGDDATSVRALRWFLAKVANEENWEPAEFRHEGRCACCGRKLTTPESLDRGIGPECFSKLGA